MEFDDNELNPEQEIDKILELQSSPEENGMRADLFLADNLEYSRSLLQEWIKDGRVLMDGRPIKPSTKLREQHNFLLEVPPLEPADPLPDPSIPLDIVYEDEYLIVLNKQKNLVIHPATGNPDGTLVNALLAHHHSWSTIRGPQKVGIVHRLDKNTSGLMVCAKEDRTHMALQNQFSDRLVQKHYECITHLVPSPAKGTIIQPIGRHTSDRRKMAVVPNGKYAHSDYQVKVAYDNKFAHIGVHLHTGRTHQIRVHMAWLGCPIVGDPMYGRRKNSWKTQGQALHCNHLEFYHPVLGKSLEFNQEPPEDFAKILTLLNQEHPSHRPGPLAEALGNSEPQPYVHP